MESKITPNHRSYILPSSNQNNLILKRLESDIAKLQTDIDQLIKNLSFITEYIIIKKQREDSRWF